MKKILFILCLFAFACQDKLDKEIAKSKVTNVLELLKKHDFEKTKQYYDNAFNETESVEARTKKFTDIEAVAGKMISYEIQGAYEQELDERNTLIINTRVICEKTTLKEIFTIGKDEGEYKILNHSVTNMGSEATGMPKTKVEEDLKKKK